MSTRSLRFHGCVSITGRLAAGLLCATATYAGSTFSITNLVSDQPGVATHVDPNLRNAWGVAFNPTGVSWVANNHTGTSTLYDGLGNPQPLVVNVPGAGGTTGAPTGIVFNGSTNFHLNGTTAPAVFLFTGEDGTISGWNPGLPPPPPSTHALIAVDNSAAGAIYKGLAISSPTAGDRIYATDFHNGRVDSFGSDFAPELSGAFLDPNLPSGFAPFGIQTLGSSVFVTYAMQDADGEDDVSGPGLGFVDEFDANGVLQRRFASQGVLNAPWAIAEAPADFGTLSGALLVGNFGDGRINAFDRATGAFLGALSDGSGNPIRIDGLWGMSFGNGFQNQPTNTLFFAAGPDDESHGLYGRVDLVPEPMTLALMSIALFALRGRR